MKKILIINSNIDERFKIKICLRRYNIQWIEARNGEEAINKIKSIIPDLIITEYVLGGMSCEQTLKRIKDKLDVPIIIIAQEGFELQIKQMSVNIYLKKPIIEEKLISQIEGLLGKLPLKQVDEKPIIKERKIKRKRIKIVIADDQEEIRLLFKAILKDSFDIILATDGEELIEKVKQEKPDLVISDIVMPRLSGYKAIKQLRQYKWFENTPVIFNSGLVKDKDLYETLKPPGPSVFILKPFNKEIIISQIKNFLQI